MRDLTHVLGIAGAVALLAVSSLAHAVPVCPPVEFAELQTYTEKELDDLASKYIKGLLATPISEAQNCNEQFRRVLRIRSARFPKKPTTTTPATPAG